MNCTSGWEEKDGQCYFWSQEKQYWGEAEERCRSLGGHLASVTTQEEYDYLMLNVRNIEKIHNNSNECCR